MSRATQNNTAPWRARACRVALLVVGAAGLLSSAPAQEEPEDKVGVARTALEKWVETRKLISKERRDWELGKEMLEDRIELVRDEIASLREKIESAQSSIAEADEKREELIAENEGLKRAAETIHASVAGLEARTKGLLTRLPEPVTDKVKALIQRLPEDPETTEQAITQRFLNVIGILNETNRFNRQITVASEVRTLDDGALAEVTALYVGIGQAYYSRAKGNVAGMGRATAEGWTWTAANDSAAEIARAIAIFQAEEGADFVRLPAEID